MMDYYRLQNDVNLEGRWFLGEVNFEGEWDFWKYAGVGDVEEPKKDLEVVLKEEGMPLDFTMADFGLFIVNEKVANLLSRDEVHLIPIKISSIISNNIYYLMTIKKEVDCVNELESNFDKWEKDDPIRPDKAGQYKTFYKLVIDPNRCHGHDIFKIKNYHSTTILSDKLKKAFVKNKVVGIKYKKVS